MSVISAPVMEALAVLDEEAGTFTIEVRLSTGHEIQFSSTPGADAIAELKAALTETAAQPVKPKRRTRRKKEDTAS